nr:putative G-protein coupled receptor [Biomphalaria glabrata]
MNPRNSSWELNDITGQDYHLYIPDEVAELLRTSCYGIVSPIVSVFGVLANSINIWVYYMTSLIQGDLIKFVYSDFITVEGEVVISVDLTGSKQVQCTGNIQIGSKQVQCTGKIQTGRKQVQCTGNIQTGRKQVQCTGNIKTGSKQVQCTGDIQTGSKQVQCTGNIQTGSKQVQCTGNIQIGSKQVQCTGKIQTGRKQVQCTGNIQTGRKQVPCTGNIQTGRKQVQCTGNIQTGSKQVQCTGNIQIGSKQVQCTGKIQTGRKQVQCTGNIQTGRKQVQCTGNIQTGSKQVQCTGNIQTGSKQVQCTGNIQTGRKQVQCTGNIQTGRKQFPCTGNIQTGRKQVQCTGNIQTGSKQVQCTGNIQIGSKQVQCTGKIQTGRKQVQCTGNIQTGRKQVQCTGNIQTGSKQVQCTGNIQTGSKQVQCTGNIQTGSKQVQCTGNIQTGSKQVQCTGRIQTGRKKVQCTGKIQIGRKLVWCTGKFRQEESRHGLGESVNISFLTLAFTDLAGLLCCLWYGIGISPLLAFRTDLGFDSLDVAFITGAFPRVFFSKVTCWITVYISLERCFCIVAPLHVKTLITPRTTILILTVLYIAGVLTTFPVLYVGVMFLDWKTDSVHNRTFLALGYREDYFSVNNALTPVIVATFMASFIVIVVSSITLTVALQRKSKWRLNSSKSTASDVNILSKRDTNLSKTILILSAVLIVSYLPYTINNILLATIDGFTLYGKYNNFFVVMWSFSWLFETLNSATSIFIYYNMSTKFKETFKRLAPSFCCTLLETWTRHYHTTLKKL